MEIPAAKVGAANVKRVQSMNTILFIHNNVCKCVHISVCLSEIFEFINCDLQK